MGTANPVIRIMVAEDHELIREGIKKIVRTSRDMQVVGEAANIPDTLGLLAQLDPDILVLDLSFHGIGELEGLAQVRQRFPRLPVLVLSMHAEEDFGVPAMRLGAAGYVTKAMAAEEVVVALRKIASGGKYISPRVAELLIDSSTELPAAPPHEALTTRERQILSMLASGMSVKQIAAQLAISVSSVYTYRGRIFQKTGLDSTASLVRYAVAHGLVE